MSVIYNDGKGAGLLLFVLVLPFILLNGLLVLLNVFEPPATKTVDWKRGDRATLDYSKMNDYEKNVYAGCKVTFIASTVTSNDNIAFVQVENCKFQKDGNYDPLYVELFSLSDLIKVSE